MVWAFPLCFHSPGDLILPFYLSNPWKYAWNLRTSATILQLWATKRCTIFCKVMIGTAPGSQCQGGLREREDSEGERSILRRACLWGCAICFCSSSRADTLLWLWSPPHLTQSWGASHPTTEFTLRQTRWQPFVCIWWHIWALEASSSPVVLLSSTPWQNLDLSVFLAAVSLPSGY